MTRGDIREVTMEDTVDGYFTFLKSVLGYTDLDDTLHGDVCWALTECKDQHEFLFLLPRGHLKSTCVTIGYPLWRGLQDPNRTFMILNESEELPLEFIREMREHLEGELIARFWADVVPAKNERKVWKTDAVQFKRSRVSRTPTIFASSVGKATAGRHPDVMILDDIVSNKTVESEGQIAKTLATFKRLEPILEPPSEEDHVIGQQIVIGTRWHWNDLYSHIIDELADDYLIMKRSAKEDEFGNADMNGRIIFPQKMSDEVLDRKRRKMGEWEFSAQYFNEPVDTENAAFTPSMVRKALWHGSRTQFLQSQFCNVFTAADPAWEGEDAWGIVTGCMDPAGVLRILEVVRCRQRVDEAITAVVAQVLKWGSQQVGMEAVGGQEWLRRNVQQQLRASGCHVPVRAMSHENQNKIMRILRLVPEIRYDRLKIHETNKELRQELLQFPRGRFRDVADACEMLVRLAKRPGLGADRRMRPSHLVKGTGDYEMKEILTGSSVLNPDWGPKRQKGRR